ncbi:uncharacterized protein B0I36DRAFT_242113 [Microdochium trichocladiopsis]|uniref:VASt domain-containing protein n=1 Tax=Microdochium trichocladiopsis TaxID=1682393 RepID=A0A9P8Y6P0_9PEZI|nr:uncharacterized protein B0I36DRAFT_242113 [Microdochium trichocladiopsis]KAH7030913.1 hypothetical protein B0I36DRAFT_242113 [Microdochium trichocladiopsis]
MDAASLSGSSSTSKISKLLPKKLAVHRRLRNHPSGESLDSAASSDDGPRGRSPSSRELPAGKGSFSTSHGSEPSLIEDDNSIDGDDAEAAISPFGYEGDEAVSGRRSSVRPTVPSTHPSQIGHLTTSSPFIQDQHLSEIQTLDHGDSSDASIASSDIAPSTDRAQAVTPPEHHADEPVEAPPAKQSLRPFRPQPSIDTSAPPRTPPQAETFPPEIVNTPPTPTDSRHNSVSSSPASSRIAQLPNVVVSHSGNMISHRRARAGSAASIGPSKLSNITAAPLTPTPENVGPPTPGAGFFSSVFSAAQNAANTLTNTINTGISPNTPKGKSASSTKLDDQSKDDRVEVVPSAAQAKSGNMGGKELAVKTLGSGGLSLEQLGIADHGSASPTPTMSRFPEKPAESRLRSESAPVDVSSEVQASNQLEEPSLMRPSSLAGSVTPPTSLYEGKSNIQRSSSIRSAISRRRKRGSTGGTATTSATGNTIGAAIVAANASITNPQAGGGAPKFTGFAVASKKRNRDFHGLFKSVPDDDYLIEDYSCALQREILAHGRLYVSEGHLCFSSNILGWSTTLVMSFDEIVSVEKRSTALVFKNGLMISTLHAKHVFASFTSRDSTYDLIVNIWKLGHPTLRSTLNGVSLGDETGGDKTEKIDADEIAAEANSGSGTDDEEEDDSDDGEDIYDEDEDEDDVPQATQTTELSSADTDAEKITTRKVSGAVPGGMSAEKADGAPAPSAAATFPGPTTHAPTECSEADTHFEVALADDVIPAPLGQIYDFMFGPTSVTWMAKWLTGEQKCTDLQMEDKKGLTNDNKTRHYTYIKPLYAPIGPKQTKCLVDETVEALDLEKSVSVLVAVQNPDVPSGNVFSVKTKYCLTWAENNSTRVNVNCTIEWTGKSWLKGPIEKGAKDGQMQYCKDLFAALKSAVSSRSRATGGNGATGKGKKKKGKSKQSDASNENQKVSERQASKASDWGIFEPLHGLLGPVGDIVKPVFTGNVVYGLFVGLLVASFFGFGLRPAGPGYGRSLGFMSHAERQIAYDQAWRNEEGDLWDWLEDRVGHHRLSSDAVPVQMRVVEPQAVEEKLRQERMNEKEMAEAIRVTEEKLKILKSVMDQRSKAAGSSTLRGRPTERVPEL